MFGPRCTRPADAILLAGSGRSGTTWISNIITANRNVRVIFEPFKQDRVPEAAGLPSRQYARPFGTYPDLELLARATLSGQISNEWVNREGYRWWAGRLLVKAIRATLMLAWIDTTFHPHIVYMLRHPCAVVLSRRTLGWQSNPAALLDQDELTHDYLRPFAHRIRAAETSLQRHTVMWCIENMVPLQQMQAYNWIVCTYESLCARPEQEATRILAELGIRKTWLTQRAIRRPSVVSRPDSAVVQGKDPLVDWQRKLSDNEIAEILSIIADFGITVYDADPMPHLNRLERARTPVVPEPTQSRSNNSYPAART